MTALLDWLTAPQTIFFLGVTLTVFMALQMSAAVMVYAERKVSAFMQQRYGPYLVGPKGMLQPVADIVKRNAPQFVIEQPDGQGSRSETDGRPDLVLPLHAARVLSRPSRQRR